MGAFNARRLHEMQFLGQITSLNEHCGWITSDDTHAFLRRNVYLHPSEVKSAQCFDVVKFCLKVENNQFQATSVFVLSGEKDSQEGTLGDAGLDAESTLVPSDDGSVDSTDVTHRLAATRNLREAQLLPAQGIRRSSRNVLGTTGNTFGVPLDTVYSWEGFTPFETPFQLLAAAS